MLDDQPDSSINMENKWWGGEEGVDQNGNYGEASGEILYQPEHADDTRS